MLHFLRRAQLRILPALLLSFSLALAAALPSASAGQEVRFGQGILWQVQKDGGPVSFVLGTIHSTDPRLQDLPAPLRRALEDSRNVAFEFVTAEIDLDIPGVEQLHVFQAIGA